MLLFWMSGGLWEVVAYEKWSRTRYISGQKLLHFALISHFASIVTFCGVTYAHTFLDI